MYAYNKCVTYILITDDGDVESVKDITDNTDTKTNDTTNKDHAAKLVDEKRKHLERRLSAAQRDALLLNEAKEDRAERKEFREMLKASNESFITALNNMSESMRAIRQCIARTTISYHNASPQPLYRLQPDYHIPQLPQAQQYFPPQQLPSSSDFIELQPANTTFHHRETYDPK